MTPPLTKLRKKLLKHAYLHRPKMLRERPWFALLASATELREQHQERRSANLTLAETLKHWLM